MAWSRGVFGHAGCAGSHLHAEGAAIDVERGRYVVPQDQPERPGESVGYAQPDPVLHAEPELRLALARHRERRGCRRRAVVEERETEDDEQHERAEGEEERAHLAERDRGGRHQDKREEPRPRDRQRGKHAQRGTSRRASTRRHTASASSPSISASARSTRRWRSVGGTSAFTSSGVTKSRPSIAAAAFAARSRA